MAALTCEGWGWTWQGQQWPGCQPRSRNDNRRWCRKSLLAYQKLCWLHRPQNWSVNQHLLSLHHHTPLPWWMSAYQGGKIVCSGVWGKGGEKERKREKKERQRVMIDSWYFSTHKREKQLYPSWDFFLCPVILQCCNVANLLLWRGETPWSSCYSHLYSWVRCALTGTRRCTLTLRRLRSNWSASKQVWISWRQDHPGNKNLRLVRLFYKS